MNKITVLKIVLILPLLISGCVTTNVEYAYVRKDAITPSKDFEGKVEVIDVQSNHFTVPKKSLEQVFLKTLMGNGYHYKGGNSKYLVSLNLLEGKVTSGFTNTATYSIEYKIFKENQAEPVFKTTIHSEATAGTSPDVLGALVAGMNAVSGSYQPIVPGSDNEVSVQAMSEEDFKLGLPEPGTPINSSNGTKRVGFVIDAALRNNFVLFLVELNGIEVKP